MDRPDAAQAILVTGGAGFIGSNFVRLALALTADRVVVLDKLTYAGNRANLADLEADPRFTFVQGDIADAGAVEQLLAAHRPWAVINFAAETHVDRSIDAPGGFVHTNVVGAHALLEACRNHHKALAPPSRERFRLLQVSTDEVFGSLGPNERFTEASPYAPNSPYAASKAAADHFARAYHTTFGLPVIITNCSNNYGPYQFPEKLIPLMILNAAEGRPLPIYGDGGNVRDWLHVEDHCAGILTALRRGRLGESYAFGGDTERTNVQIVDQICEILEKLRPAAQNPQLKTKGHKHYQDLKTFVADRLGHDRRYAIDATKARRELGWAPRHDFASGLTATVSWYLDHADWCQSVQNKAGYQRERLGQGQGHTPS
jgi:dTDP-glucose 4,6-dehydratase